MQPRLRTLWLGLGLALCLSPVATQGVTIGYKATVVRLRAEGTTSNWKNLDGDSWFLGIRTSVNNEEFKWYVTVDGTLRGFAWSGDGMAQYLPTSSNTIQKGGKASWSSSYKLEGFEDDGGGSRDAYVAYTSSHDVRSDSLFKEVYGAGGKYTFVLSWDWWYESKPPAPTLTARDLDNDGTRVTLQWTSNETHIISTDNYRVQIATDSGFNNRVVNSTTGSTGTSKSYSGLTPNTRYYCRVAAHNDLGDGPWSNVWTVRTPTAYGPRNCLYLDGGRHVALEDESRFDFASSLTVEAWVKVEQFTTSYQAVVTKGDSTWRLHRWGTRDAIGFHCNLAAGGVARAEGDIPVDDGRWHHLAGTADSATGKIRLYVDGVLDAEGTFAGSLRTDGYGVAIGENLQQTGRDWRGWVDEVRVWNVARTAAQIREGMCRALTDAEINAGAVVGYWPLDQTGDSRAYDVAPGHSDGTVVGGTSGAWQSSGAYNTWLGGSTNWHTSGNWSRGAVPGEDDNVLVPASAPHDPVLQSPAVANHVVLANGTTLDLGDTMLDLNGNWISLSTGGPATLPGNNSLARVYFSGSHTDSQYVLGNTSFPRILRGYSGTILFEPGSTQTMRGFVSLQGWNTDTPLTLHSAEPGTQWNLVLEAGQSLDGLDLQDCAVNIPLSLAAVSNLDSGNNTNWTFIGPVTNLDIASADSGGDRLLNADEATPAFGWGSAGGLAQYEVDLDGPLSDTETRATPDYTAPGLPQGSYTLSVRQSDSCLNWTEAATLNFTVDTTPALAPVFDTTPTPRTNDTQPSWTWRSSDPTGAGLFQYRSYREGGLVPDWGSATTATSYEPSAEWSEGTWTLEVRELDEATNPSAAASSSCVIDTTAPPKPEVGPDEGLVDARGAVVTINPQPTWYWRSDDDHPSGTSRYQLALDDAYLSPDRWRETSATSYTPPAPLASGAYTLHVGDRDAAGNWSASTGVFTWKITDVGDNHPYTAAADTQTLIRLEKTGATADAADVQAFAATQSVVAVAGSHAGDLQFGTDSVAGTGGYVASRTGEGNWNWGRGVTSGDVDGKPQFHAAAIAGSDVYVTCAFIGDLDVQGAANPVASAPPGATAAAILKFTGSGTLDWACVLTPTGSGSAIVNDLAIPVGGGRLGFCGDFTGAFERPPIGAESGPQTVPAGAYGDLFAGCVDLGGGSDGELTDFYTWGSPAGPLGVTDESAATLVFDASGGVVVAGQTRAGANWFAGAGQACTGLGWFLAQFDSSLAPVALNHAVNPCGGGTNASVITRLTFTSGRLFGVGSFACELSETMGGVSYPGVDTVFAVDDRDGLVLMFNDDLAVTGIQQMGSQQDCRIDACCPDPLGGIYIAGTCDTDDVQFGLQTVFVPPKDSGGSVGGIPAGAALLMARIRYDEFSGRLQWLNNTRLNETHRGTDLISLAGMTATEELLLVAGAFAGDRLAIDNGGEMVNFFADGGGITPFLMTFRSNDTDGDGLPDQWERAQEPYITADGTRLLFDPFDPADAQADWDGDRMSNLQEYLRDGDAYVPQAWGAVDIGVELPADPTPKVYVKLLGESAGQHASSVSAAAADTHGALYLCGQLGADAQVTFGETVLDDEAFVAKLDANMLYEWVFDLRDTDAGHAVTITDVAVAGGVVCVTGGYSTSLWRGQDKLLDNGSDGFRLRLDADTGEVLDASTGHASGITRTPTAVAPDGRHWVGWQGEIRTYAADGTPGASNVAAGNARCLASDKNGDVWAGFGGTVRRYAGVDVAGPGATFTSGGLLVNNMASAGNALLVVGTLGTQGKLLELDIADATQNGSTVTVPANGTLDDVSLDAAGNVFVAGFDADVDKMFIAKYDSSLTQLWLRHTTTTGSCDATQAVAGLQYDAVADRFLLTARFADGTVAIGDGGRMVELSTDATPQSFLTAWKQGGELFLRYHLTVDSPVAIGVEPFVGTQSFIEGSRIQVTVPALVYSMFADPNQTVWVESPETVKEDLDPFDVKDECAGYTIGDGAKWEAGNRYEFVIGENTRVKFKWETYYRLDIINQIVLPADPLLHGLDDGMVAGLGTPAPAIGYHWMTRDAQVSAAINTINQSSNPQEVDTRYALGSYEGTGKIADSPADFQPREGYWTRIGDTQGRRFFIVQRPLTLTYNWKKQFRVVLRTDTPGSVGLPFVTLLRTGALSETDDLLSDTLTDDFWFDYGSHLQLGAPEEDWRTRLGVIGLQTALCDGQMSGKALEDATLRHVANYLEAVVHLGEYPEREANRRKEYVFEIDALTEPTQIAWMFETYCYPTVIGIGGSVDFADLPFYLREQRHGKSHAVAATTIEPAVTVQRTATGIGGTDAFTAQVWDDVAKKLYPLRPVEMLLDWQTQDGAANELIRVRVYSGFAEDAFDATEAEGTLLKEYTQYPVPSPDPRRRHIADTPQVDLDPSADDKFAYVGGQADLRDRLYTEGDGAVTEGKFTASVEGRTVLVFSRSMDADLSARGDRTREPLRVRVVETKKHDCDLDWDGVAALPRLEPAAQTIAAPLASAYDTAAIGTGCVFFDYDPDNLARKPDGEYIGNFNADAYYSTATSVPRGPIFPVNRVYWPNPVTDPLSESADLLVVWYETVPEVREPDNILWPYMPVVYRTFAWPTEGDRIVIASRLGSDGLRADGDPQLVFDPNTIANVQIYNQPDPGLAGCNPNEEHALVATSYAYLAHDNPPPAAYALQTELNATTWGPNYTSDPYVLVQYTETDAEGNATVKMIAYQVELSDEAIADPRVARRNLPRPAKVSETLDNYAFEYPAEAGEPVLAPYPLPQVIGANPYPDTRPIDDSDPADDYPDTEQERFDAPEGTVVMSGDPTQVTWLIDRFANGWIISGNSWVLARWYYPMRADFWYPTDIDVGDPVPFAQQVEPAVGEYYPPVVTYATFWPDQVATLKAGESWTYSGGEFRADYPDAPGLPTLVGWKTGEIVYDDLNPKMEALTTTDKVNRQWTLRLIDPLTERRVGFPRAILPTWLQPASDLIEVAGPEWRFASLSASLKRRVYYDPLTAELVLRGFLNGKELGDPALTAAPGASYLLEFNTLTAEELAELQALDDGETDEESDWDKTAKGLYDYARNPNVINSSLINPDDCVLIGLQGELTSDSKRKLAEWEAGKMEAWEEEKLRRSEHENTKYWLSFALGGWYPYANEFYEWELDAEQDEDKPVLTHARAVPFTGVGPGLAAVPNQEFLNPKTALTLPSGGQIPDNFESYVTVIENNDALAGEGPVAVHVIKVKRDCRYRGSVKVVYSDNVFDEKIVLRHTGDFGTNTGDLVYQWFLREEDGTSRPLPTAELPDAWQLFGKAEVGAFQKTLKGQGELILRDNLVFVRYCHMNELVPPGETEPDLGIMDWTGTKWDTYFDDHAYTVNERQFLAAGEWAGAANSPDVDGNFRPLLVMGWVKRVLDAINPYEARIADFYNNESPAAYVSMIQQFGQRYEGPVPLNADKNVIENVGLIELYQTVLNRAAALSIDLSQPVNSPGVCNAIMLAATRLSEFYTLLGHEAWADAMDPTVGIGSDHLSFGTIATSLFAFMNQVPSLLDEELALVRGVDDTYGRPFYNRLFPNFTKSQGEAAYVMNYAIQENDGDGFINEADAMIQFPQGHGDAWGHYLTAARTHYDMLRHPYFKWQTRSEYYNLTDVVFKVDYLDERRFARAAAAKAKAGVQALKLTYRSRYVDDPGGQWQGYTDTNADRAWGCDGWARRTEQGAIFDWYTANALLPADAPATKEGIEHIDRTTVPEVDEIAVQVVAIENELAGIDGGLNPLGLHTDAVPFDIDPAKIYRLQSVTATHFEQIAERAEQALCNAAAALDYANRHENRLRQIVAEASNLAVEALEQDAQLRKQLIEIFGTPYTGTIGAGKFFPVGYEGPDTSLFMYVDRNTILYKDPNILSKTQIIDTRAYPLAFAAFFPGDIRWMFDDGSKPGLLQDTFAPSTADGVNPLDYFGSLWKGVFGSDITLASGFVNDNEYVIWPEEDSYHDFAVPYKTEDYSYEAPDEWGQRLYTGQIQDVISDMLLAQIDVRGAIKGYTGKLKDFNLMLQKLQCDAQIEDIAILQRSLKRVYAIKKNLLDTAKKVKDLTKKGTKDAFEITLDIPGDALPEMQIAGTAVSAPIGVPPKVGGTIGKFALSIADLVIEIGNLLVVGGLDWALEEVAAWADYSAANQTSYLKFKKSLMDIARKAGSEEGARIGIEASLEKLDKVERRYHNILQEGYMLLREREKYNKKIAFTTQTNRYADMTLRVTVNDALQKYHSTFDQASRYVYLAAKAYDYETNFDENHPASARHVLTDIVRQRSLGVIQGGHPVVGVDGLADILGRLQADYAVLKGQMGFGNPQVEPGRFSLRYEHFRVEHAASGNTAWRMALEQSRVENLWDLPEFRMYCRPFAAYDPDVPEPALVIPMSTQIVSRYNFFGWPAGAADHAYDPSHFATKVRSVGLWLTDYDTGHLTETPRAYLIPAGQDIMTVPTDDTLGTRVWNIVEQRIPVPYALGSTELADPHWIPALDGLDGAFVDRIRHSSFRVCHDDGYLSEDDMVYTSRLVGRSVWNTRWLLVIPGASMHFDPDKALNRFIYGQDDLPADPSDAVPGGVSDIKLFFETYSHSGG